MFALTVAMRFIHSHFLGFRKSSRNGVAVKWIESADKGFGGFDNPVSNIFVEFFQSPFP
ncbi:MAG: hypothetical protein IPL59_17405 [Candidatus Competibacteraceae bacterium]|nr:hypothetical protein [Candidatus Competibacteraceae bacterium]